MAPPGVSLFGSSFMPDVLMPVAACVAYRLLVRDPVNVDIRQYFVRYLAVA